MPCLRLRGLPFKASEHDVAMFLAAYSTQADHVVMCANEEGRPSGEALVSFPNPDDATRAVAEMQHQQMGSRYVELFKGSYDEWKQAKAGGGCAGKGGAMGGKGMWGMMMGGGDPWAAAFQ